MDKDIKRLAFGHKALSLAAWLGVVWVTLAVFRMYLLPQGFEKLATQHEGLCSWVPSNLLYDGLMAYLPGMLSYILPIVIVLVSTIAFWNIKPGEPLRRKASASLYASIAFAILVTLFALSVHTARKTAPLAAVKSNLSSIRAQAELYWGTHGGYGPPANTCFTGETLFTDKYISNSICGVVAKSRSNDVLCRSTDDAYIVSAPLRDNRNLWKKNEYWCVDSTGMATSTKVHPTGLSCVN